MELHYHLSGETLKNTKPLGNKMSPHTENRKGVNVVLTGYVRVVPQRKSAHFTNL
jgi:hypothetical protein